MSWCLKACIEDQDIQVRTSTVQTLLAICPEGNQARKCVHDVFLFWKYFTVRTLFFVTVKFFLYETSLFYSSQLFLLRQAAISALISRVKNSPRDVQALASEAWTIARGT